MSTPLLDYPTESPVRCIQTVVASAFGVGRDELLSDRREPRVARPRQVAMYLARDLTRHSLPHIGRHFGRDHTTVMHSVKRVEGLMVADAEFARLVVDLGIQLRGMLGDAGATERTIDEVLDLARHQLKAKARHNPEAVLRGLAGLCELL